MNGDTYTSSGSASFTVIDGVTYMFGPLIVPVGDTNGQS